MDDELKNRLKVDFPPEVKEMLIKQHNAASDEMKP